MPCRTRGGLSVESDYLKTFVEVARTGNITRASEILCVTQPAVSRRIQHLEDRLGKVLLDRSGPVLTLTPAGSLVLKKASKILDIEQELLCDLSSMEKQQGLSLASTTSFGLVHLPGIMGEFMLQCPNTGNLKIRFDLPEKIVKGLRAGLYDIAVVEHCQSFDLSDFETVTLPGDEMVFAGAPFLNIPASPVPIEILLSKTLFGRHEGCCSRTLLENNLQAVGRNISDFRRLVVFDDLNQIVQALLKGDGIAFISRDIVREQLDRGELYDYRVSGFTQQRKRTFVTGGRLPPDSLAGQFFQILCRHFKTPDGLPTQDQPDGMSP
jgi:LysR family transcriptional regulator, transcriptional activator of the cysJI operon